MPRPGDRRPLITDRAIGVLATGGARALSHHAVDRAAGLSAGSTSYYFRTREALIAGVIERIQQHSREAFQAGGAPEPPTVDAASRFIAQQLGDLASRRRDQATAIIALLPELNADSPDRPRLLGALFSAEGAVNLARALACREPERTAEDLLDLLLGRLIRMLFLPDRAGDQAGAERTESTAASVARLLASARA